jgi:gamma-glutamyltranspeptidase/glutathione hydrolase
VAARAVLFGTDLDEAQRAPRWTVSDFGPGSSPHPTVEADTPGSVVSGLRSRGHEVSVAAEPQPGWGPLSIIEIDGDRRRAAADPRVDTTAALVFP